MSLPDPEVIRPILNLRGEADPMTGARVDICRGGRVRLMFSSEAETQLLYCDTLEELAEVAAAEPGLSRELYDRLVWELDLRGLRGDG